MVGDIVQGMDNQTGADCECQDVAATYVRCGLGGIVRGWGLVIDDCAGRRGLVIDDCAGRGSLVIDYLAGLGSLTNDYLARLNLMNDYLAGRRRRVMACRWRALPGRVINDVAFAMIVGASDCRGAGENDDGQQGSQ
ncbi:MAG: hypothetical protein FWD51_00490 [Betaproteobacteria bacterium]|nr:hypothetical protein [Betaproteobacteria bacterium]